MGSISVLTLVQSRRDHLRRMVESLARSQEPPAELIVVNMDDMPLVLPRQKFSVRVIDYPCGDTLPLSAARNRAAAAAQNRLLFFMDADCMVSARSLGLIGGFFQSQDCMLCPEVLYLPKDAIGAGGAWQEEALRKRGVPHPARSFPRQGTKLEPNPGFLWSVAVAVRASTFDRLGGFDEQFTGYGAEDTDLGFNAAARGVKLMYVAGAPVLHQYHPSFRPPLQHFPAIVRNAALFHSKWGVWPMQESLDAFVMAGLLERSANRLRIIRYPNAAEIAAAKQPANVTF